MIASFRCGQTQKIFDGEFSSAFPSEIQNTVRRKLRVMHAAINLNDLRQPPGNRLEKLSGDREGQHSIRVNDQWRICFVWEDGAAHHVELTKHYE
jgi:toxin HigB-1